MDARLERQMEKVVVILDGHNNQIGGLVESHRLLAEAVGELKTAQLKCAARLGALIRTIDEWIRNQRPPQA
jgi:hypothetical protein